MDGTGIRGSRKILLTGATGFVGGAVRPALVASGWQVRGLTRDAARARLRAPELEWIEGDVADARAALEGCEAALYLVHGIGEGADYHAREVEAAERFAAAAAAAGVKRIVYLGGVAPGGAGSDHLRSRLDVGEALRRGTVLCVELRASMIVGHGSLSWLIVRDLAARLPVMVLPRWLRSRTEPVAIHDVVIALVRALELPLASSEWFDVPGPEILSGSEILERTSHVMGLPRPRTISVPLLTPHLSSLWVRFVTRARWSIAREVVVGLTEDLLAKSDRFWPLIDHPTRLTFAEAAVSALDAERAEPPARGPWGLVERARRPQSAVLAIACVLAWMAAAVVAPRAGLWLAIGGVAILLGAAVTALDGAAIRETLRPSPWRILLGVATGLLMAGATWLLYPPVVRAAPFVVADTEFLYSAFRATSRWTGALVLIPVILGEELAWRHVVQSALVKRFGPATGIALAAAVYALAHAPLGSPVLVLAALGCGLVWGALRFATGSLVPTLVAHLLWDGLVLFWLPLIAS